MISFREYADRILGMGIIRSEFKRLLSLRLFFIWVLLTALLIANGADQLYAVSQTADWNSPAYSVVEFMQYIMSFDKYKTLLVLAAAIPFTGVFCEDYNSGFLRMILSRTSWKKYIRTVFLINLLTNLFLFGASFFGTGLLLHLKLPLSLRQNTVGLFYKNLIDHSPLLFLIAGGLQFGIISGMCCSIGILFSLHQENLFVTRVLPACIFLVSASYIPRFSAFSVMNMIAMKNVLADFGIQSPALSFLWGLLLPFLIIVITEQLSERKLDWRMKNGMV